MAARALTGGMTSTDPIPMRMVRYQQCLKLVLRVLMAHEAERRLAKVMGSASSAA